MTASTVKSSALTAQLVTDPRTPQVNGKQLQVYTDTHEAATTSIDETGDVILFKGIHSSAILHQLIVMTDDLDSHATPTLAYDIGVYNGPDKFVVPVSGTDTAYAAFAVVDADAFASAITVGQAATTTTMANQRFEAADIAGLNKPLWELLGMDRDPNKVFTVGMTITTTAATPVAGTISVQGLLSA